MNYYDIGEGFPVVFLHGWGGSAESFGFVAGSLKRSFRTVRVDFAGFGASPPPDCAWGAREYADDVKKLLDTLGISECVLVCHSFGGRIGIVLATQYPDLVRGLVLVDSAGIRPRLSLRKRLAVRRYKRRKAERRSEDCGSSDYRAAGDAMRKTFVKVVNDDLSDKLALIQASTLIVWGTQDRETPPKMAKIMAKSITDSALVWLEGGHFSYVDCAYAFIRILDAYLLEVTK